jgi:hypothetical protein
LIPESLKKTWEGVVRSIGVSGVSVFEEFNAAFTDIRLNSGYVEKS